MLLCVHLLSPWTHTLLLASGEFCASLNYYFRPSDHNTSTLHFALCNTFLILNISRASVALNAELAKKKHQRNCIIEFRIKLFALWLPPKVKSMVHFRQCANFFAIFPIRQNLHTCVQHFLHTSHCCLQYSQFKHADKHHVTVTVTEIRWFCELTTGLNVYEAFFIHGRRELNHLFFYCSNYKGEVIVFYRFWIRYIRKVSSL